MQQPKHHWKWFWYSAATLSFGAAVVHVWVAPEHFEEWWGYGAFFVVAAVAQGLFGLALLRSSGRRLVLAGIAMNAVFIALYLVTRTVGIPLLGPHAGHVEPFGGVDVISNLIELTLVLALLPLSVAGNRSQMNRWWPAIAAVAGLLVVASAACSGNANGDDTDGPGYVPSTSQSSSKESAAWADSAASGADSSQSRRVARLLEGFPLWIGNGEPISIGSSLDAEVTVLPYPPGREGVLDLVLRNPADGSPIAGASVETTARMRYMDHGVFRSSGTERTGEQAALGHYRTPLRLPMPGDWAVTVHVSAGAITEEFDLLVVVSQ